MIQTHALITSYAQSDTILGGGVGTQDALQFLNTAICISTYLNPTALWFELRVIETKLGRFRMFLNAPRTIDLDILWWSRGHYSDESVSLPHPRIKGRKFAIDLAKQALKKTEAQKAPPSFRDHSLEFF